MKLIIDKKNLKKVDSGYDHNVYQCIGINRDIKIIEICDEYNDLCEYYMIAEGKKIFIGTIQGYLITI